MSCLGLFSKELQQRVACFPLEENGMKGRHERGKESDNAQKNECNYKSQLGDC